MCTGIGMTEKGGNADVPQGFSVCSPPTHAEGQQKLLARTTRLPGGLCSLRPAQSLPEACYVQDALVACISSVVLTADDSPNVLVEIIARKFLLRAISVHCISRPSEAKNKFLLCCIIYALET